MLIYHVECRVDPEIAEEWKTYFTETHLDDVLDTNCFIGYSFRQDEELRDGQVACVSEYHCFSQEHLDDYQANHAAALKQDVIDKFGGRFTASRRVFHVITERE